jgi:prepilin-type N-terminal cleavage/methylation domain-containing protein
MNRVLARIRDEGGMTLIELMIAVSLLGVVMGPILGSFLISMLETTATRDRISDSSGAQAVSSFLIPDIQSAKAVSPGPTTTCLPAALAGATVHLVLAWDDPSDPADATKSTTVTYASVANGSGQRTLHRASCTGSAQETTRLASNMAASNGFAATCDGAACSSAATPRRVVASLTLESLDPQSNSSYGALTFDIKATRRVGL